VLRLVARAADRAALEPDDEPAMLEALAEAAGAATPTRTPTRRRSRRRCGHPAQTTRRPDSDRARAYTRSTQPRRSPPAIALAGAGYRIRWAKLLARVFEHDVLLCSHCGEPTKVIAAVTDTDVAARILAHLGLPAVLPDLAPARAPPQTAMFSDDETDA
jgi:hypothetical protein